MNNEKILEEFKKCFKYKNLTEDEREIAKGYSVLVSKVDGYWLPVSSFEIEEFIKKALQQKDQELIEKIEDRKNNCMVGASIEHSSDIAPYKRALNDLISLIKNQ